MSINMNELTIWMPGWYFADKRWLASVKEENMNLTEVPETVTWPETHYVFVEKIGPFQTNAPQAWQSSPPIRCRRLPNTIRSLDT